MIKAIALDDEPPALSVLAAFCRKVDELDLVRSFTKTNEALDYLKSYPIDLIFLDINMPSISGLEFRKMLPPEIMVILASAFSEFGVEGFNLNVIDYLLKPFTFERFLQTVEKAKLSYQFHHQNDVRKPDHISVRVDYSLVKILLSDILFIEGLDDYVKIHLQHQNPVITRMTMKSIAEKLPQAEFIRVHRSYIVPFLRIRSVRNKIICIQEEEIPIGNSYEDDFLSKFNR